MDIVKIAGLGLVCVALCVFIKQLKPEFSVYIPIVCCGVMIIYILSDVCGLFVKITEMFDACGISVKYLEIMFRCTGLAYVTKISSDICRDCGESGIGTNIELCGKTAIIAVCIPIVSETVMYIREILSLI